MDLITINGIVNHALIKTNNVEQFYNSYLNKKLVLQPCKLIESTIEFDKLIFYLKEIEKTSIGGSKSKFNSAYTGIDSNGNLVSYSALLLWFNYNDTYLETYTAQDNGDFNYVTKLKNYILYKYNFNPNLIPLNRELKIQERFNKINDILE